MLMQHQKYYIVLYLSLMCLVFFPCKSFTAEISFYWSGHVTNVISFKNGALPSGISTGSLIKGQLLFNSTQYFAGGGILGNAEYGCRYHFDDNLQQQIEIESWKWVINGSSISLIEGNYSESHHVFDSFSNSTDNTYSAFPNYVGSFNYGFAIYDKILPFQLFVPCQMDDLTLNLDEVSEMHGFLTTRFYEENSGDITDGYYIIFNIDKISSTPIIHNSPVAIMPSVLHLLLNNQ